VSAFVHVEHAPRRFIAALRVLLTVCSCGSLGISVHHLDRGMAVAGEDEQPRTVDVVELTVSPRLFKPNQPPCAGEPFPVASAILACAYAS
jgi:hypothetical protein